MTNASTRRSILAGMAAVPTTLTLPAFGSQAQNEPDPIFAAIEGHRVAFKQLMPVYAAYSDDPKTNEAALDVAHDREEKAACSLTEIQPTTLAGVIALLSYIDHFNRGGLRLPDRPTVYSEHLLWPDDLVDDDGRELPFPYWLLENVRAALAVISQG